MVVFATAKLHLLRLLVFDKLKEVLRLDSVECWHERGNECKHAGLFIFGALQLRDHHVHRPIEKVDLAACTFRFDDYVCLLLVLFDNAGPVWDAQVRNAPLGADPDFVAELVLAMLLQTVSLVVRVEGCGQDVGIMATDDV